MTTWPSLVGTAAPPRDPNVDGDEEEEDDDEVDDDREKPLRGGRLPRRSLRLVARVMSRTQQFRGSERDSRLEKRPRPRGTGVGVRDRGRALGLESGLGLTCVDQLTPW